MTAKQANLIAKDEQLRKRLSKFMARECFRNTELENLHAGTSASSRTRDYSDVMVVSPFGEIPWPNVSCLSDEEMKILIIDVNKTYRWLTFLFACDGGTEQLLRMLQMQDPQPEWNEPQLSS